MTNGTFEWNHTKGYINIPVSFLTTIDTLEKGDIHIVCPKCSTQVKQRHLCPKCEKDNKKDTNVKFLFEKKELTNKKDFDRDVVFLEAAEREYTRSKVKPVIHVEQEISLADVTLNANFICGANKEIINNEEQFAPWVKKIHDYLTRNQKALLVTYGENGRIRAGFVLATPGKLSLFELYAGEQMREPVQLNLEMLENPLLGKLKALSENTSVKLYDEFIEKVKNGEKIEIEEKEAPIKPILEATFLDA
jgi:hypothetical protein